MPHIEYTTFNVPSNSGPVPYQRFFSGYVSTVNRLVNNLQTS